MNVTLRLPQMTREQFLDWAARQQTPFEFDGYEPVPMTGANLRHARLCQRLLKALLLRLDAATFEMLSEAGIATVGDAVRFPDLLITATLGDDSGPLVPEPLIVFEVVSPSSGRIDHHIKLREYAAVPSILRYVILDNVGPDLTVFSRAGSGLAWTAESLTIGNSLKLPEVGFELPVDELFEGLRFET